MEHSKDFDFWKMAYDQNWIGDTPEAKADYLKGAVKTDANPYGEITPEEYKEITETEFA